jgi:hypothetical protein
VELFSGRHLTYLEDKLNAFVGIAKTLEASLRTEFLYGLPTRYFDWALLWEPRESSARNQAFPSWSWAGWDGAVEWKVSTLSGPLTNLHEWLTHHTWIDWAYCAKGDSILRYVYQELSCIFNRGNRWDGYYTNEASNPYRRIMLPNSVENMVLGKSYPISPSLMPFKQDGGYLHFPTFSATLNLNCRIMLRL